MLSENQKNPRFTQEERLLLNELVIVSKAMTSQGLNQKQKITYLQSVWSEEKIKKVFELAEFLLSNVESEKVETYLRSSKSLDIHPFNLN
jgi:hypothetical protein